MKAKNPINTIKLSDILNLDPWPIPTYSTEIKSDPESKYLNIFFRKRAVNFWPC